VKRTKVKKSDVLSLKKMLPTIIIILIIIIFTTLMVIQKVVYVNFCNRAANHLFYYTYNCYTKGRLVEPTSRIKFIIIILQKAVCVIE